MSPGEIHSDPGPPRTEPRSLQALLARWVRRTPWLAVSAVAHLLVFLILAAIPWEEFQPQQEKIVTASIAPEAEELFAERIEELESVADEVSEEPELEDTELDPETWTEASQSASEDFLAASGSDLAARGAAFDDVIGIGGGAGTKLGGRIGRGQAERPSGGKDTEQALANGLDWLAAHQSSDGSWDGDGFAARCGKLGATACDGPGSPLHDVGLSALALLAFLGEGSTTTAGTYRETVKKGVEWLRKQQDRDTGLIGERSSQEFLYDHAIATLALCEAYVFSKNPILKKSAQKGIDFIHGARNPRGAWRYDVPPSGQNDTSVTGWMVLALTSADDAGLEVDPQALQGALAWLDQVTDPATGHVGYDGLGVLSSRTKANEHFPSEKGEAMTAVGLLCRLFLHQDPAEVAVMHKQAELLLHKLPEWDPTGFGTDMYYWYYGTYAMFQMGGDKYWKPWRAAMEAAVVRSQSQEGDERGSWDPIGPWGYVGGRIYSTALMVLCLEVYFRYERVLRAR